ncbi:MAG: hypothetical protein IPL96_06095 [Holophagaceae bacterium]|nr:hypothetical protein [Holophagaceae bacterium]
MNRFVAILLAFACWTAALAAGEPITIGEVFRIPSKVLGEDRILSCPHP